MLNVRFEDCAGRASENERKRGGAGGGAGSRHRGGLLVRQARGRRSGTHGREPIQRTKDRTGEEREVRPWMVRNLMARKHEDRSRQGGGTPAGRGTLRRDCVGRRRLPRWLRHQRLSAADL